MKVLELSFPSPIGLLSLFTVALIIGMTIFPFVYVTNHMKEPGA